MNRPVFVGGVGMTRFRKPSDVLDWDYPQMVAEAGNAALADAGIEITDVDVAYGSYVLGESCSGHRGVYEIGATGIPIYNVNSNCSSGSSALSLARQAIQFGIHDIALCVGFEKMSGPVGIPADDRAYPCGPHIEAATVQHPLDISRPWSAQVFANAGREHMAKHGSEPRHFAMIGEKNHRHSSRNPNAQFQDVSTLQEVLDSPCIYDPLTRLQCSAPSTGAAAVVLISETAVTRYGSRARAVEIVGQGVATDQQDSFGTSAIHAVGYGMSQRAARQAYDESGLTVDDVDVIELHDCFSTNELLTYEALGLAPEGKGHLLLEAGDTTYGGRWVVNPSGGLIGKGHPLGATGLAQCTELSWQLRGEADDRQVGDAEVALQHNLGLGGTAVVTMYRAAAAPATV